jgi:hypothetical protein
MSGERTFTNTASLAGIVMLTAIEASGKRTVKPDDSCT